MQTKIWAGVLPSSRNEINLYRKARTGARAFTSGLCFSDGGKVRVGGCLLRREALLVIIPQELGHKVNGFLRHQVLILRRDELLPRLLRVTAQDAIEVGVQFKIVSVKVVEQLFGAEDLGNLHELVVVVMAVEEGLLAEDHPGEHAAQTPHVEGIVVLLQIDEELRAFEVTRGNADVVLSAGVVELRQTPVDEAELPLLVVDHDVVGLHVAVHDAVGVAIIQRLEQLEDVVPDVVVRQGGVQDLEVGVVHVLEDEGGGLALRVADDVEELDDVGSAAHVLEDLDLALDLLLLDGLKDLDDALGVAPDVDSLEDLAVLAPPDLADHLVVLLVAPVHGEGFIVPVISGPMDVDIGIYSSPRHIDKRRCRRGPCYAAQQRRIPSR
mmetsp:Transcript_12929/g.36903  ORF Transcript_12929/g.36903 Transcript_12929/m.36903 type:complete len:382 (-) Transcript_12929:17-1162(-)